MKIKIIIELENESDGMKVFDALTKIKDELPTSEDPETPAPISTPFGEM